MKPLTIALVLYLSTVVALADETVAKQDTPSAEKAADVADNATTSAETTEVAMPGQEVKLPPGFAKVKRGKHVLYCKKDSSVGTRFKTEKCFDEAGLRDYILAQQQNNRDFDRARSTCTNQGACGGT